MDDFEDNDDYPVYSDADESQENEDDNEDGEDNNEDEVVITISCEESQGLHQSLAYPYK